MMVTQECKLFLREEFSRNSERTLEVIFARFFRDFHRKTPHFFFVSHFIPDKMWLAFLRNVMQFSTISCRSWFGDVNLSCINTKIDILWPPSIHNTYCKKKKKQKKVLFGCHTWTGDHFCVLLYYFLQKLQCSAIP